MLLLPRPWLHAWWVDWVSLGVPGRVGTLVARGGGLLWCVPITPPCAPRLHAPLSGPTHGRVAHDPASDLSQGFAEVPQALFGGLLWGSSKNSRHLRKINIVFCARRCGVCGEHAMEVVVMEAKEMLAMAQGVGGRQGR